MMSDIDNDIDFKSNSYEDDLQLAAELGKNLLERNQTLETQIQHMMHVQNEQKLEIELLQKQVEVLKSVNESRLHMYEDIDRNAHELERMNSQLMKDRKCDRDTILRLNETIHKLEEKCINLESSLEEYAAKSYESPTNLIRKRTTSVPSLTRICKDGINYEFSGMPLNSDDEASSLWSRQQQTIKRLEMQMTIEKNKRKHLESDFTSIMQEQKLLEEKLLKEIHELENQLNAAQSAVKPKITEANNSKMIVRPSFLNPDKESLIECDIDFLPHGRLIRLKNGGSAYGSQESLNKIGLEADEDMTPSIEVCSAIIASDINNRNVEQRTKEQRKASSLLAELEEQYHSLVTRYEALIEAKQKSSQTDRSTQDNLDSISTLKSFHCSKSSLDLTSPIDPTDGHFETSPPEYKRLFKEIFQTLRKSSLFDADL